MISRHLESAGLPTALITPLVPVAVTFGGFRIIPGCAINYPVGDPTIPRKAEKELRRNIVLSALESIFTHLKESKIFDWRN